MVLVPIFCTCCAASGTDLLYLLRGVWYCALSFCTRCGVGGTDGVPGRVGVRGQRERSARCSRTL
eukprot:3065520-Rhodomonas_salina.1